jgi:hypothetical protein
MGLWLRGRAFGDYASLNRARPVTRRVACRGIEGLGRLGDLLACDSSLFGQWRLCEQAVEAAREVALEAAERALAGLALAFLALKVLAGDGVALGAGDRDRVQRPVELAVAAAIEPVLGLLPGGAGDRRGARLAAEARVGAEPFRAGGAADQSAAVSAPQPCSSSSAGR